MNNPTSFTRLMDGDELHAVLEAWSAVPPKTIQVENDNGVVVEAHITGLAAMPALGDNVPWSVTFVQID